MRRMGGLRTKIPHTYRTMLIGSIAIAGIPPLAGFFSKDEILGEAFKLGFQWVWAIGLVRRPHDRVLHVPADRADVLGQEPRRPERVEPHIHESPPVMTVAAVAAGDPVDLPRHHPVAARAAARAAARLRARPEGPPRDLARARLRPGRGAARPRRGVVQPLRHRRRPDPRERRGRGHRHGRRLAAVRRRALAAPLDRQPGARPDADRPRAVPLPRLAEQVVVRRPQPPAVHGHRRPGRRVPVVVRPAGRSTTPSTTSRPTTVGAGRGLRRVQTGRVQNYALGIALGLIVMAGSFLVLAAR